MISSGIEGSIAREWTLVSVRWSGLVFFSWLALIWMFISVFADIFRRDMSGWEKAGWIALIVILPFLCILIYLIARPKGEPVGWAAGEPEYYGGGRAPNRSAADEIAKAAQLQAEGKISNDEFELLKRQALSR